MSDELYSPPRNSPLKIVEIFPSAADCSPSQADASCEDYVKLYNSSDTVVDLGQFRLRTGVYGQAATSSTTAALSGALASGHYISVPLSLSSTGSYAYLEDTYGTIRYDSTITQFPSASGHDAEAWSYNGRTSNWQWTRYPTPSDVQNQFSYGATYNSCTNIKISEIAANVDKQFIEIYNTSSHQTSLTGCILKTNRSSVDYYVFPKSSALGPNQYLAVDIAKTPLSLTKTSEGTVYILDSDESAETDSVAYEDLKADTSYALIGSNWRQTYAQTPGLPNTYAEYPNCAGGYFRNLSTGYCNKLTETNSPLKACATNQYRSAETNRCRLFAATISTKKACAANQYRNVETNRCRLLSTTNSASLKACASNQYRNKATNRCRLIATATSALKPCASNQTRNPETNRCRKSAASLIPTANFPVSQTSTNSAENSIGWLAFAGVGTLAGGYAGWEWRREVARIFGALFRRKP